MFLMLGIHSDNILAWLRQDTDVCKVAGRKEIQQVTFQSVFCLFGLIFTIQNWTAKCLFLKRCRIVAWLKRVFTHFVCVYYCHLCIIRFLKYAFIGLLQNIEQVRRFVCILGLQNRRNAPDLIALHRDRIVFVEVSWEVIPQFFHPSVS